MVNTGVRVGVVVVRISDFGGEDGIKVAMSEFEFAPKLTEHMMLQLET